MRRNSHKQPFQCFSALLLIFFLFTGVASAKDPVKISSILSKDQEIQVAKIKERLEIQAPVQFRADAKLLANQYSWLLQRMRFLGKSLASQQVKTIRQLEPSFERSLCLIASGNFHNPKRLEELFKYYQEPSGLSPYRHCRWPHPKFNKKYGTSEYLSAWEFLLIAPPTKEVRRFHTSGRHGIPVFVALNTIGSQTSIPLLMNLYLPKNNASTATVANSRIIRALGAILQQPTALSLTSILEVATLFRNVKTEKFKPFPGEQPFSLWMAEFMAKQEKNWDPILVQYLSDLEEKGRPAWKTDFVKLLRRKMEEEKKRSLLISKLKTFAQKRDFESFWKLAEECGEAVAVRNASVSLPYRGFPSEQGMKWLRRCTSSSTKGMLCSILCRGISSPGFSKSITALSKEESSLKDRILIERLEELLKDIEKQEKSDWWDEFLALYDLVQKGNYTMFWKQAKMPKNRTAIGRVAIGRAAAFLPYQGFDGQDLVEWFESTSDTGEQFLIMASLLRSRPDKKLAQRIETCIKTTHSQADPRIKGFAIQYCQKTKASLLKQGPKPSCVTD
jgi:hypothetical protein